MTFTKRVALACCLCLPALGGAGVAQMFLETTFAGGNGLEGNMFDVVASPGLDLDIVSLDANLNPGSGTVEIWTRQGTHVGFESSNVGWRFLGSAVVLSAGAGTPTPIPIAIDVTIPAGGTQAFFVHNTNSLTYTDGTALGSVAASDANFSILEGTGLLYFSSPFAPRIWNGVIHYEIGAASVTTSFAGGNGFDGNMFDVEASGGKPLKVVSMDANLDAGLGTVEIWTRPGTFVGFESSSAGWTQVGAALVISLGNGQPTPIPITVDTTIPAGQTQAFYVHNSNGVDYTNGVAVGAVAASDAFMTLREGKGGPYFGVTIATRVWNGTIHYEVPRNVSPGFAGGNFFDGNMFDVVASGGRDVTVRSMDGNFSGGPGNVEIWTRPGTFVGHETSSLGWNLVGTASVEGAGVGGGTHVPIEINVTIVAGQTQAFYLHNDGGVSYTNGTAVGLVAAGDEFVQIQEGNGGGYFNVVHTPRIWNGTLYYTVESTCATTSFRAGNGFDGNMFDVIASGGQAVTVLSMAGNLSAGAGMVEIWTRPGSYVGFHTSSLGWTMVGAQGVSSPGTGVPTWAPINIDVTIPSGQTQAFYFHNSNGVRYSNGTGVGNVAVQDESITILEGAGGSYFNVTNTPRIWNGILCYSTGLCSGICGDCNLSGAGPDILDALTAAQIAVGITAPTQAQMGCCDVDSSGAPTVVDALLMAQFSAGLLVALICP